MQSGYFAVYNCEMKRSKSAQRDLRRLPQRVLSRSCNLITSSWNKAFGKQNKENQFKGQVNVEITCADPAARYRACAFACCGVIFATSCELTSSTRKSSTPRIRLMLRSTLFYTSAAFYAPLRMTQRGCTIKQ